MSPASPGLRRLAPEHVVVLAGVAAALHVGKLPTAIPVLREAIGLGLVEAGFLLSLVQLAGMLFGAVAGIAADSLGLRRTMGGGLLLLSVAGAAGAAVDTPAALLAWRALEGFGFLLACMPAPGLIRRLVPDARMPAALGLWGAYMPLGTALALLLGPLGLGTLGWKGWWVVLATVSLAAAAWLYVAVPVDTPQPVRPAGEGSGGRLRRTLSARGPWLVALAFAAYSSQWLSLVGFLPTVYAQAGWSPGAAGLATAVVALVNMAGNIASGRLLQRGVAPERLLRVGFATMAAGGLLAFPEAAPAPARLAAAVLFSMVGGLIPGTLFALAVRFAPGPGTISTTVGWMQQWSSFGQFAGPPVVALVASHAGGWSWGAAVTVSCAATGLLLTRPIAQRVRASRF